MKTRRGFIGTLVGAAVALVTKLTKSRVPYGQKESLPNGCFRAVFRTGTIPKNAQFGYVIRLKKDTVEHA